MKASVVSLSVMSAALFLLASVACGSAPSAGAGEQSEARPITSLYRADQLAGFDGWTTSEDWTEQRGELLSRGQDFSRAVGAVAPIELDGTQDFAAEAEIRLLRYTVTNGSFGVMVRVQDDGAGYGAGHDAADELIVLQTQPGPQQPLDSQPYTPGDGWHRYRVEVRGNELRAFVDGAPVLSTTDNTFLSGARVGLWSSGAQLSVRNFEVVQLEG